MYGKEIGQKKRVYNGGDAVSTKEFAQMLEQYQKLVYTVCYQMTGDHFQAQDLAQETFIAAYTHLDSCPTGAEKPWLVRIAANKAKDYLKSAYHRRVLTADDDTALTDSNPLSNAPPTPEDISVSNEQLAQITRLVHTLKEPYALVCTMHFLQDKTIDEISRELNRPYKTVHTQIYRGKILLQKQLRGGG